MSKFATYKTFPCTMCGCCCKRIGLLIEQGIDFPFKAREDGACEMLTEDNKCKVYDNRPTLCNIDALAKLLHQDKKSFYRQNIKACNKMMENDKIPHEYKIN